MTTEKIALVGRNIDIEAWMTLLMCYLPKLRYPRCLPCKSLYSDVCFSSRAVLDITITITHNLRVLSRSYSCRTNRVAQGFGFASAADFVIQSAITRLGGAPDTDRWVTCKHRRRIQRLQVPKGSTTWGFIDDAFGIVVTDVLVKVRGDSPFELKSPAELQNGDSIEVNHKEAPSCVVC
jgi:hypothetical protein